MDSSIYAFSKNQILFARMSSLLYPSKLHCCVVNLLLNGIIKFDGLVDTDFLSLAKKRELWAYLFYIWSNNRSLDDFKTPPTPESLEDFVVKKHNIQTLYVTKKHLANVINTIIIRNQNIKISVISKLLNTIQAKISKEEAVLQKAIESIEGIQQKHNANFENVGKVRDSQGNVLPGISARVTLQDESGVNA